MILYLPRSKFSLPDVDAIIIMLSWISTSFLTDTALPILKREDLVVIKLDPWCASGKYIRLWVADTREFWIIGIVKNQNPSSIPFY